MWPAFAVPVVSPAYGYAESNTPIPGIVAGDNYELTAWGVQLIVAEERISV